MPDRYQLNSFQNCERIVGSVNLPPGQSEQDRSDGRVLANVPVEKLEEGIERQIGRRSSFGRYFLADTPGFSHLGNDPNFRLRPAA